MRVLLVQPATMERLSTSKGRDVETPSRMRSVLFNQFRPNAGCRSLSSVIY